MHQTNITISGRIKNQTGPQRGYFYPREQHTGLTCSRVALLTARLKKIIGGLLTQTYFHIFKRELCHQQ